jgi:predicted oxidoreductase (fatty acid repression mutant protein)
MATRAAGTSNEELLTAIRSLETRMNNRITSMKRDLTQEREQADEHLVKRMKMEKPPTFKRNSHEVQYTFNEEVKAKFDSVKAALHKTLPAVEKGKFAID